MTGQVLAGCPYASPHHPKPGGVSGVLVQCFSTVQPLGNTEGLLLRSDSRRVSGEIAHRGDEDVSCSRRAPQVLELSDGTFDGLNRMEVAILAQ